MLTVVAAVVDKIVVKVLVTILIDVLKFLNWLLGSPVQTALELIKIAIVGSIALKNLLTNFILLKIIKSGPIGLKVVVLGILASFNKLILKDLTLPLKLKAIKSILGFSPLQTLLQLPKNGIVSLIAIKSILINFFLLKILKSGPKALPAVVLGILAASAKLILKGPLIPLIKVLKVPILILTSPLQTLLLLPKMAILSAIAIKSLFNNFFLLKILKGGTKPLKLVLLGILPVVGIAAAVVAAAIAVAIAAAIGASFFIFL